jgi:TPR repeat protein
MAYGNYGSYEVTLKAAEGGDVEAQIMLGSAYELGLDGEKCHKSAILWYRNAADSGNMEAQHLLGRLLLEYDVDNAIYFLTLAAEQGYVEAQTSLALEFCPGGKQKNTEKALYWGNKLIEQNNAEGYLTLGIVYLKSEIKDPEKAKMYLTKASEMDSEIAEDLASDSEARRAMGKGGCYVATCVYGSYDCPEVWTLRRFRDNTLANSFFGRCFIRTYYAVSPKIIKIFGQKTWFHKLFKPMLNKLVSALKIHGFDDKPYSDNI